LVLEVIVFVLKDRATELGNLFDLCSAWFGPNFDVAVITIKDDGRHESKSGEVKWHPDVNVVCGCGVFSGRPEQ
jgi:hypothetical protein